MHQNFLHLSRQFDVIVFTIRTKDMETRRREHAVQHLHPYFTNNRYPKQDVLSVTIEQVIEHFYMENPDEQYAVLWEEHFELIQERNYAGVFYYYKSRAIHGGKRKTKRRHINKKNAKVNAKEYNERHFALTF